jgi:hypothetical protein
MGDGVAFATIGRGNYGFARGGVAVDCAGPCGGVGAGGGSEQEPYQLLVLGGFDTGHLAAGHIRVEPTDDSSNWWGFWGAAPSVYAYGKHALLLSQSDVAIVDAATASQPAIAKRVPLIAYPSFVDMGKTAALLTLGTQGVQWITLE